MRVGEVYVPTTVAWCDGSCVKAGHGGWGVLIHSATGRVSELYGGQVDTTISVMELKAVIMASLAAPAEEQSVIYSDSKYVIDGITDYIYMWLRTGWRTSANKPLKHLDMWQRLYAISQQKQIDYRWVKGHSGDAGNHRADRLAYKGRLCVTPPRG